MDIGAIASASIDMHLAQAQQGAQIAVLKKAMNMEASQAAQLIEQMAPPPSFGHQLDVYV